MLSDKIRRIAREDMDPDLILVDKLDVYKGEQMYKFLNAGAHRSSYDVIGNATAILAYAEHLGYKGAVYFDQKVPGAGEGWRGGKYEVIKGRGF